MWEKYQKKALQEMRNYIPGEDLTGVSVAENETPKEGGKIARDAQGSQWYVSPEFMSENYVLAETMEPSIKPMELCFNAISDERIYQDHLPNHSFERDANHSISDWLIFIESQLNSAKSFIYQLDRQGAMHAIRKIAALGVACMQHNGVVFRKYPGKQPRPQSQRG